MQVGSMQQMCSDMSNCDAPFSNVSAQGMPPRPYSTRSATAAARAYSYSVVRPLSRPTSTDIMTSRDENCNSGNGGFLGTFSGGHYGFGSGCGGGITSPTPPLYARTSPPPFTQLVDLPKDEHSWSRRSPTGKVAPLPPPGQLSGDHLVADIAGSRPAPPGHHAWPPYAWEGAWNVNPQGIWSAATSVPPVTGPSSSGPQTLDPLIPVSSSGFLIGTSEGRFVDPAAAAAHTSRDVYASEHTIQGTGESLTSRNSSSTAMVDGHADGGADASHEGLPSTGKLPLTAPPIWPQPQDKVIFFHLSDKMPAYALKGHFEKYGAVESVMLHHADNQCVLLPVHATAPHIQMKYAYKVQHYCTLNAIVCHSSQ
jgi:hypothetical protein